MRFGRADGAGRIRWPVVPLAVFVLVLISWAAFEGLGLVDLTGVLDRLTDMPAAHAAALILVLLLVDVLIPIPSTPLMVLAGTILGMPGGVALAVVGSMGSSVCAYGIGRFGAGWLRRALIDADELREMHQWGRRFGPVVFGLARALPMMAETAGISAGLSRVPFLLFVKYTFLGTLPICFAYGVAGSQAETAEEVLLIAVSGSLAALAVGYVLRRHLRRRNTSSER